VKLKTEQPKANGDEIYLDSARRLRANLPKFVIFLGVAVLLWLLGTYFVIPLGKGEKIGSLDIYRLDFLILLAATLVLIVAAFLEIGIVADSLAGLVASYITHREAPIEEVRLRKIKRSFRTAAYIIPIVVSYLLFAGYLEKIYPPLNVIIPVIIVIWVVVAAILLCMVLGVELEEASRLFVDTIEKRMKIIRKKEQKKSA